MNVTKRPGRAAAGCLAAVALVLTLGLVGRLAGSEPDEATPGSVGLAVASEPVTVVSIVDGDTIHVRRRSDPDDTVRIVGVDTPETKKPGVPVQCFGPEATAATTSRLPIGSRIMLESDTSDRDRYGRLLRYVRLPDGTDLGMWLVLFGYAKADKVRPDTARSDDYAAAELTARHAVIGLWSRCEEGR